MTHLPKPKVKIPVAVYGFRDQTGQFKTSPDSAYSTMVTQGAASILMKALEDSGWYVPVEREGLQNLLTERRIIRAIESPTEKGKPVVNLPNMIPAAVIIEGGVIGYEANVRTGGKGANYLGIGASTQYRIDQVTVGLRSVDVRNGQLLNSVSVTKTIYSYQFSANLYKFTSYQHLLQAETGYSTNEPAQLAVREAIESAVIHLTVGGIRERYFEMQDPGAWDNPVVQAYLAEALTNVGEAPPEVDALIPMRPTASGRESIQPWALPSEDPARPAAPAPVPRPAAAPRQSVPQAPVVQAPAVQLPAAAVQTSPPASVAPTNLQPARTAATPAALPTAVASPVSSAPLLVPVPVPVQGRQPLTGIPTVASAAPAVPPVAPQVVVPAAPASRLVPASSAPTATLTPIATPTPTPTAPPPPPQAPQRAASAAGAPAVSEPPAKGKAASARDDIFEMYRKSR